jgi:hypothetical protein
MELQQYTFEIKHRPGKRNANADALSRRPVQESEDSKEEIVENFYQTSINQQIHY